MKKGKLLIAAALISLSTLYGNYEDDLELMGYFLTGNLQKAQLFLESFLPRQQHSLLTQIQIFAPLDSRQISVLLWLTNKNNNDRTIQTVLSRLPMSVDKQELEDICELMDLYNLQKFMKENPA